MVIMMVAEKNITHLLEDPEEELKLLVQLSFSDDGIKTISPAESAYRSVFCSPTSVDKVSLCRIA